VLVEFGVMNSDYEIVEVGEEIVSEMDPKDEIDSDKLRAEISSKLGTTTLEVSSITKPEPTKEPDPKETKSMKKAREAKAKLMAEKEAERIKAETEEKRLEEELKKVKEDRVKAAHEKEKVDAMDLKTISAEAGSVISDVGAKGEEMIGGAAFMDLVKMEGTSIKAETLIEHLNKFAQTCRLTEGYLPKEIQIYSVEGAEMKTEFLIAAGTKVLDAILYVSVGEGEETSHLFDIHILPKIERAIAAPNIMNAKSAFCAGICMVYNRGNLPTTAIILKEGVEVEKPLQKFITSILHWSNPPKSEKELAEMLSCTNTTKFPSVSLLSINLKHLPGPVAGRCQLSIAGNKVVRLAAFAGKYEKRTATPVNKDTDLERIDKITKFNNELKIAHSIVKNLIDQMANIKGQLNLHPLVKKGIPAGFVSECIKAILFSLSDKGRAAMVTEIKEKGMGVLAMDSMLTGELGIGGIITWPILKDEGIDFTKWNGQSIAKLFETEKE